MRHALLITLLLICTSLRAEMRLETIELHNRTAEDVIPVLQPMVQNGGSISGSGYKLFIRTTPTNLEQLQSMIAAIDVAAKQLLVSVSLDRSVMRENSQLAGRVSIQSNPSLQVGGRTGVPSNGEIQGQTGNIKYDARMVERSETQRTPKVQQVRVTEGLWATIRVGQGIPITSSLRNPDGTVTETFTYQAVASGFQVLPRVNGDNVILTIHPQAQSSNQNPTGVYSTLEVQTTVTGKLGQWFSLGSTEETQNSSGAGITYRTQQHSTDNNQIYVKVDLVK